MLKQLIFGCCTLCLWHLQAQSVDMALLAQKIKLAEAGTFSYTMTETTTASGVSDVVKTQAMIYKSEREFAMIDSSHVMIVNDSCTLYVDHASQLIIYAKNTIAPSGFQAQMEMTNLNSLERLPREIINDSTVIFTVENANGISKMSYNAINGDLLSISINEVARPQLYNDMPAMVTKTKQIEVNRLSSTIVNALPLVTSFISRENDSITPALNYIDYAIIIN
ncbi:MAG TPA: hypothetical protein PK511_15200 [Chitinophagales bacterium]|nr:hypothetical protein [Saprospiraceae bacterium]HNE47243.1 hypothetical protein [Chitinophagales bacterium]HNF70725.1 hypothetical protein [Chitinophagales bacterium]HNI55873.1 hypothetical protein [Chitinophagales bacterium]HNJ90771.1 hypothetical protein [Chitinophagales bacterium]